MFLLPHSHRCPYSSIHPSIHASASLVLGPSSLWCWCMQTPTARAIFSLPLPCTPTFSPLPFYFGGDLCTAAFCKGQLRAGLAVSPPNCQHLLLELVLVPVVPTKGSEAAQCEPWWGHKNGASSLREKPFHVRGFGCCSRRCHHWCSINDHTLTDK